MSTPMILSRRGGGLSVPRRLLATAAVLLARLLALLPPGRIRSVLGWLRQGARPASHDQTLAARNAVTAVSLECRGTRGCVTRSIATALLCRAWGVWPTWCVGVRKIGPFAAHAWVEVDGALVGEDLPDDYFHRLIAVRPVGARWSDELGPGTRRDFSPTDGG
jgi:hypothetical protein